MDLGLFCVNLGWKEGQGSSSFGTRGQKSCERWLDLLAPVFLALANVGLVAELSHLLGLGRPPSGMPSVQTDNEPRQGGSRGSRPT